MFFTAVNTMFIDHYREKDYEVTKPRIAVYKHKWKIHQNTVYWCHLTVAQSKGLQFYHTRSNAIILYNTLLAMCIERWWSGSQEKNCTPQAPTRESLSIILTSTVERTEKLVVVKWTSGSKDCPIRLSQEHDHIRKQAVQKLIHSSRITRTKKHYKQTYKKIACSICSVRVEGSDLQHGKHGELRDLRDHYQHTMSKLYDILAERYCM